GSGLGGLVAGGVQLPLQPRPVAQLLLLGPQPGFGVFHGQALQTSLQGGDFRCDLGWVRGGGRLVARHSESGSTGHMPEPAPRQAREAHEVLRHGGAPGPLPRRPLRGVARSPGQSQRPGRARAATEPQLNAREFGGFTWGGANQIRREPPSAGGSANSGNTSWPNSGGQDFDREAGQEGHSGE